MARKIRKFSEGGAQGMYNRRMADIEKDRKIDLARGKNADVVEAKAAQRKADAEDDKAKRMGLDRTATSTAERTAERNLSMTRKYGAPKAVTTEAPAAKITDSLGAITAPKSGISESDSKPKSFGAAFKEARARLGSGKTFTYNGKSFTTNIAGEGRKPTSRTVTANPSRTVTANPKADTSKADAPKADYRKINFGKPGATTAAEPVKTTPPKPRDPRQVAYEKYLNDRDKELGKSLSALNPFGNIKDRAAAYNAKLKAAGKLAKGGKAKNMKKYAKGGSIPPQPTPADRKADAKFRESVKKIKVTPAQGKTIESAGRYAKGGVTKEMPSSKAMGSMNMAKGGKAKAKGKAKGNPFAATKFGAAMMKKGADAKGRAMKKFAKGGSIDGCAQRGKTKLKRVTMKKGGSC
jgi:hypothetical protein